MRVFLEFSANRGRMTDKRGAKRFFLFISVIWKKKVTTSKYFSTICSFSLASCKWLKMTHSPLIFEIYKNCLPTDQHLSPYSGSRARKIQKMCPKSRKLKSSEIITRSSGKVKNAPSDFPKALNPKLGDI